MHAFAAGICTADEVAELERTPFFERWASGVPAMLNDLGQDHAYEGPRSIDPEWLASVTVPVLVLRGGETYLASLWGESAEHVAQYVPNAQVHTLHHLAHFAPVLAPDLVSAELISFVESIRQPA